MYYISYILLMTFCYGKFKTLASSRNCPVKKNSICDSTINVRWWEIPPYIYHSSNRTEGLFPAILEGLVRDCCGKCTAIDYSNLVLEEAEIMNDLGSISYINFPVYGQMTDAFKAEKPYLPIIESPGIVYMTSKSKATSSSYKVILESVTKAWPIFLFIYIMALISGIIVWALDCYVNCEHFPVNFFRGSWEGFWWSIVSMTTVGYGDRCPKSLMARVFSIIYVLMGLVIISLFNSQLTTALTAFAVTSDPILQGENVAVITGLMEEKYAATLMVERTGVQNVTELKILLNSKSHNAMLDAYVAGHYDDLFGEENGVLLREVFEHSYAYGMILSGKYENSKMQQCFLRELSLNPNKITNVIQETRKTLEFSARSIALMKKDNMLSATSPTSKTFFFICAGVLGLFAIAGFAWHIRQKCQAKKRIKQEEEANKHMEYVAMPSCNTMEELITVQNKDLEEAMRTEVERFYRTWNKKKEELFRKCSKVSVCKPSAFNSVKASRKKNKKSAEEAIDTPKYDYVEKKNEFELVDVNI